MVVIGGGGHGLATAYYLAKEHGIGNVAVLEKGWIGSGNAGRNTTIIRSNYLLPGNIPFYEWSMKLWENLERELNYNVMVSQRGVLNLYHSDAQRDAYARRGNAMRLNGVDAELLDLAQVRAMLPFLNYDDARFPVQGGLLAAIWGGVMYVRILWVARTLRGKGHGQRLLAAAEQRAIERGCRHVFLDTFNFQAPDFYVKQGYEIYARADDWPVGHAHFFLRKALPSPP